MNRAPKNFATGPAQVGRHRSQMRLKQREVVCRERLQQAIADYGLLRLRHCSAPVRGKSTRGLLAVRARIVMRAVQVQAALGEICSKLNRADHAKSDANNANKWTKFHQDPS